MSGIRSFDNLRIFFAKMEKTCPKHIISRAVFSFFYHGFFPPPGKNPQTLKLSEETHQEPQNVSFTFPSEPNFPPTAAVHVSPGISNIISLVYCKTEHFEIPFTCYFYKWMTLGHNPFMIFKIFLLDTTIAYMNNQLGHRVKR